MISSANLSLLFNQFLYLDNSPVRMYGFDMFPHTDHVEALLVLERDTEVPQGDRGFAIPSLRPKAKEEVESILSKRKAERAAKDAALAATAASDSTETTESIEPAQKVKQTETSC